MMPNDKIEFDRQLEILFGGFPAFLTEPRKEAYWRGLQKMPIHGFIRAVDHFLGESGPEKMPTLHGVWQTYKDFRATNARSVAKSTEVDARDKFDRFADHLFLNYLMRRQGSTETSLKEMLAIKKQIADDYRLIAQDEFIEPTEMADTLHKRWAKVFESSKKAA